MRTFPEMRGTPSHHPNFSGIVHRKSSIFGIPHVWKPPYDITIWPSSLLCFSRLFVLYFMIIYIYIKSCHIISYHIIYHIISYHIISLLSLLLFFSHVPHIYLPKAHGSPIDRKRAVPGLKVVDVVGWAPTADTLALAENKCTKKRFTGFTMVKPTVSTGWLGTWGVVKKRTLLETCPRKCSKSWELTRFFIGKSSIDEPLSIATCYWRVPSGRNPWPCLTDLPMENGDLSIGFLQVFCPGHWGSSHFLNGNNGSGNLREPPGTSGNLREPPGMGDWSVGWSSKSLGNHR